VHKHPFASVCKRLSNARIPDVGTIGCGVDKTGGGVDEAGGGAGSRRDSSGAARDDVATDTSHNSARVMTSAPALPRRNVVILVVVVAGGVSRCVAGVQHPCSRVAAPIDLSRDFSLEFRERRFINLGCETAVSRSVLPHS